MSSLLNCLNKGTREYFPKKDNMVSIIDKKNRTSKVRSGDASLGIPYLQFAQVQVELQLQSAQVQFELAHFTF